MGIHMANSLKADSPLRGRTVTFTGRLASMTRREAMELVRKHGARFVPSVTRLTSLLVIGQEGWPLQQDGRLSNKLRKAKVLQRRGCALTILTEEGLLQRLGLESQSADVHGRYSTAELSRILQVPRDRLRAWMRAGLIQPVETVDGIAYFDFQQVSGAKTLCDLTRAGVTSERIRRSFEQLRTWLSDVQQPLAQLAVLERNGQLLVRLEEGQLAEPSGQLQLDFPSHPALSHREGEGWGVGGPAVAELTPTPTTAGHWFQVGCQHEEAGRLDDAVSAYRQALLLGGPDADLVFNLANVLYALGQKEQAAERFRQVVEIDRACAEAWNNLGNVLADLEQLEEALSAYKKALDLNPSYGDAHYNLAYLFDQLGRELEARAHWQAYLRQDVASDYAQYARRRLDG